MSMGTRERFSKCFATVVQNPQSPSNTRAGRSDAEGMSPVNHVVA
jgi:hypothetical protein